MGWRFYFACGRKQIRVGVKRHTGWSYEYKFIALEWQL